MASAEKQLRKWLVEIDNAVKGYEKKDKRKILRKAAKPVWLQAVSKAPVRKGSKLNPRYAYKGKNSRRAAKGKGRIIAYYSPGNLRDSISILSFRRAVGSVFVGPFFALGGKKKPTVLSSRQGLGDGYYSAMVYGTAKRFREKVLDPAGRATFVRARNIVFDLTRKSIVKRSGKG